MIDIQETELYKEMQPVWTQILDDAFTNGSVMQPSARQIVMSLGDDTVNENQMTMARESFKEWKSLDGQRESAQVLIDDIRKRAEEAAQKASTELYTLMDEFKGDADYG